MDHPEPCRLSLSAAASGAVPLLEFAVAGSVVLERSIFVVPVGFVVALKAIGVDPAAAKHVQQEVRGVAVVVKPIGREEVDQQPQRLL